MSGDPEEKKDLTQPTPADGISPDAISVGKVELEELKTQAEQLKKLNERADGLLYQDAGELMDDFEREILKTEKNGDQPAPVEKKPEEPAKEEPKPDSAIQAELNGVKKELEQIRKESAWGVVNSQYDSYSTRQGKLPEGERNGFERDNMLKLIVNESAIVERVARGKFNGNLWDAAAYIIKMDEGEPGLRKQGAKAAEARSKAEASATTDIGDRLKEDSPEENANEERADEIAPPDYEVV